MREPTLPALPGEGAPAGAEAWRAQRWEAWSAQQWEARSAQRWEVEAVSPIVSLPVAGAADDSSMAPGRPPEHALAELLPELFVAELLAAGLLTA